MDINKHIVEIKILQMNLETDYKYKKQEQEEFLEKVLRHYYLDMAKHELLGDKKLKEEVNNSTNDILDYTNHLYRLNNKYLELIEHLYGKLKMKGLS
ncbi:MAG: hypothetical protein HRT43_00455 [Campylobacteraceae bacterium]|nr:hypothetical protein [Campylobacteraceae bacterium]